MSNVMLTDQELAKLLEGTQWEEVDGYSRCNLCHGGGWGWPKHSKDCLFVEMIRTYLPNHWLANHIETEVK